MFRLATPLFLFFSNAAFSLPPEGFFTYPSRGCPEAFEQLAFRLAPPGKVYSVHDAPHDALAFEIEWDPIVRIEPFPQHLARQSVQTKYLAVTKLGRLLIVKPSVREFDKRTGNYFEPVHSPQARFDIAVYQLARLLGIDSVPPTVDRRWIQSEGNLPVSAQLWIHDTKPYLSPFGHTVNRWKLWQKEPNPFVREARSTKDLGRFRELNDMFLLDYLAQVYDRHGGNVLVDSNAHLILIDNSHAFRHYPDMNVPEKQWIRMDSTTRFRLNMLTREKLEGALSAYLTPREIEGVWQRRNELLGLR